MRTLLLIFCCLPLFLVACGSDEPQATGVAPPAPKAPAESAVSSRPMAPAGQSVVPVLLPDPLMAGHDVRVVVPRCTAATRFTWQVNGEVVPDVNGSVLSADLFQRDDQVTVAASCGDREGTASIVVQNSPPVVNLVAFRGGRAEVGKDLEILPEATDADGDDVSFDYLWVVGAEELSWLHGPVLPGDYVKPGREIAVTVIPNDGRDNGPAYEGKIFEPTNLPPQFVTKPPVQFRSLEYHYPARAKDPDGDALTYRLEEGPDGMTVDARTGDVRWQIPPGTTGEFKVRIVAEDPNQEYSAQEYKLTLTQQEAQSER